MGKFLTQKQRKELLDELKLERYRRYADRIRVILLLDQGKTYKSIAEHLFLDEGTIANYRKRYKNGGIEGLIIDDYSTRRIKLSESEELTLFNDLQIQLFPTTKSVIAYIEKKFGVTYSISGCNNLLHRLGFTFKKTKGVPGKAVKEKQEDFILYYNQLKEAENDSIILFGDATHPLHNTILGAGWILKGEDKEVFTNSGRSRVNIFGAISINTLDVITRSYKTINQNSVCSFLKSIRTKYPDKSKKVHLILDRGPSNKAKSVQALAKELNIEIHFLPAYSPNLNPIERLWKFFKKKVLYNKYYEKFADFKHACSNFFRMIRRYRSELSTLITDNFRAVGT